MVRPTDSFANPAVLEFYKTLPFNIRESVAGSVDAVRRVDHASAYPVLAPLLRPGQTVLDVGCGTGWMTNSLAYHHHVTGTGIDFNPVAIERAQAVAREMGLETRFSVQDLFTYAPETPFDLVVSLGVLHHTDNCALAVQRVCERMVRPGGHVLIGLYHHYGRKPFLDLFAELKAAGATEEELLARYRQLHSHLTDETLLVSWFRDQVLHPHETQHTLEEMLPILDAAGMSLVSTSINRFEPIPSRRDLFEQEKGYYDLGLQRLKENQYFTGFFVFLARKAGEAVATPGPRRRHPSAYLEHHPVFGYHYIKGVDLELPKPGGGRYRVRVNDDGIRSDRDYTRTKPANVTRIIVCGDSMAAGQFVTNAHRFSELLERRIDGLEVINLALEGSGTDQQLLLYERIGLQYEHDLVVVLPFLQNLRRNLVEAREAVEPTTGELILRGKPRFELVDGELVLRNVPVPTFIPATDERRGQTDSRQSWGQGLKSALSRLPGAERIRRPLHALVPWEPFPEYRRADTPEWQLMAAILRRFHTLANGRPVVIAPTFYSNYVRFRMARNYWTRYAELGQTPGLHVVDLLPHFTNGRSREEAMQCFLEPFDMHFSTYGHLVLADALEEELVRRRLLPSHA